MTIVVQDLFNGASGTDINTHTPDVDTVGGGWLDNGANMVELDGSGALKFTGNNDNCRIDTGSTDQITTVNFNAGGADNRVSVLLRSDNALFATATLYLVNIRAGAGGTNLLIQKRISGGASTTIASAAVTLSGSTTYEIESSVIGSALTVKINGVTELTGTDTQITAGDYSGVIHNLFTTSAARFLDFEVDDGVSTETNATVGITIPKPVFSSAAQSIAPIFNAAVSFTVSKPVFASTAQALVPIVNADVNFTIGKPEFAATAQAIPAGSGANASIFINKPVFASTAQNIAPIITGDVAFSINGPIFSATGQALGPNTNADAAFVISKPQFNAAAQAIGVDNNAAISFNIASPIFSIFAGGAVLEYYYAKGTQIALIEKSTIIKAPNKSRTLGV